MLIPAHAELLKLSAISDEVVESRGYWTATNTRELVGFASVQRRVPALVIPQHNVLGEEAHSMIRPDEPRERSGKAVKYETPSKARQVLDVNPLARAMLDDPTIPLVVTEGSRKADAAVSRGMCALSINGVWGWRGTNAKGGKTVLDDWALIALNGRAVLLAFDDDAMRNPKVHQALGALAGFLGMKRARARFVMFLPNPSGAKVGLDDWLAVNPDAGFGELEAFAVDELPQLEAGAPADTFSDVDEEPGWSVLESVRSTLTKYVWFPNDGLADAVALWIVHTYLLDVLEFTPRLHVRSPIKRSGKSRLLEVIELLVHRPMSTVQPTAAVIFRAIEASRPTLLIDEVDHLLSDQVTDRGDIVAVINKGFQSIGKTHRNVGTSADMTLKEFPIYAALAMAGIGFITDTITDRSVTIRLERRPSSERVAEFRQRAARAGTRELARRIAAWSARHAEVIGAARPAMPEGVKDRAADIWEPLLAIADVAGGTWPERARDIATALSKVADAEDVDSTLELQLLTDIHETWPTTDRRFSAEIVQALNLLDGRPWSDFGRGIGMTTNWLARKLKGFGIAPTKIRIGSEVKQGYHEERFVEIWGRYGVTDASTTDGPFHPGGDGTAGTPGTEQVIATRDVPDVPAVPAVQGSEGDIDASSNGDGTPRIPGTVKSFRKEHPR